MAAGDSGGEAGGTSGLDDGRRGGDVEQRLNARVWRSGWRRDPVRLAAEIERAGAADWFGRGTFAHSLSLPRADQVHPDHREHRNNLPFTGLLDSCPELRAIFDGLAAEKAAFRLLRRPPHSAYGLHDDRDRGRGVARMQIPIVSNDRSYLVLARPGLDRERFLRVAARRCEAQEGDPVFDFAQLDGEFGGDFELYRLEAGHAYYFDTDGLHTLVNAGATERITLSFDLIVNDWVAAWLREGMHPVDASPGGGAGWWEWGALAHGILENA